MVRQKISCIIMSSLTINSAAAHPTSINGGSGNELYTGATGQQCQTRSGAK